MIKKITLAVFSLVLSLGFLAQAQSKNEKPNIIFIFADDWGYGDISAHGSNWIETPHIDKMISKGMDFANFTVNSPVCSPSRVAVMTGQFPARQSIHQHFQGWKAHKKRGMPDWMDPTDISLPRAFQEAGYKTAHFGKWHLGWSSKDAPKESEYGYDEYATFNGSKTINIPKSGSIGVDYAEKFIKKNKNKPFFINLWLHEAHTAHYPQERFMDKFGKLDKQKQVYASVIAEGDEAVGRIMNLLKELDIDDNTLVVFSTDNGPEWEGSEKEKLHKGDEENGVAGLGKYYSVGETGGLKGQKRSLFAGGVRVPFVAMWPNVIPKGVENKTAVVTAVDLLPTFYEAAGLKLPKEYQPDGESIMSAFKGKSFKRSKSIFWEWRGGSSHEYTWPSLGVRNGDWKLVVDPETNKYELYNEVEDWKEQNNLASKYPKKVEELVAEVTAWKATLPLAPRETCMSVVRGKSKKAPKNTDKKKKAKKNKQE
ncbi:sulfatase-like hydrolase/transferase [Wenyingzhuangia sp. 2_MG-2023]|uniref:sulfatase-like hydrolase/transferase n=1 Tax=Wenyingzhuangia sp. 2_MG-2023 TaxID=3062639 RepID=UPI0026E21EF1|nr:sulfatase-like hydrolase/transferase [Wenyingzhuangia sp. 2_MG-2023]MDO6737746.1 sulfatase-like hydrolase/transferase [Wenyingzhuangia sp. 2_MG-2023]MDO6802030.1 sulfatase-like hydrolase/transferase [Wenyingzhuangia sp. 1_MG-2023]